MKLILRGRRWSFILEEIRQWLEIYEEMGTKTQAQSFVALADRQLVELQRQQQELAETIEDLARTRGEVLAYLEEGETAK